ncbi:hypothetical protein PC117_g6377 [Phytophthora cactorum]|uniref:Ankyrin repeat-containing domain n=1 Tax=Phytophthora cactorum TaxID=29920 RepID=A0A8T1E8U1_9STRA|nr:hypothetical protein PC117_g6377 [Phytophthora cactorum]
MDKAAANGHWEVVKWLHEKRSEGCTMAALDGTATNDHLDILHANEIEENTVISIDVALSRGHMEVQLGNGSVAPRKHRWMHELSNGFRSL